MTPDQTDELEVPERFNRPGLSKIKYRIGTHSAFYARMLARLASHETPSGERPLQALTTRAADDPTVAFLDAWSSALDVLTFYQERIANEGYVRTAGERRSVLELARSIGYELKPGVAASTYLAFSVEEGEDAPDTVLVPRGTQVLSIPGQDQSPQTFETSEDFIARYEYNSLGAQINVAQTIDGTTTSLYLAGLDVLIQQGDLLLIVGSEREAAAAPEDYDVFELRTVSKVTVLDEEDTTVVSWSTMLDDARLPAKPRVFVFRQSALLFGFNAPYWNDLTQEERDNIRPTSLNGNAVALLSTTAFFVGGGDGLVYKWNLSGGSPTKFDPYFGAPDPAPTAQAIMAVAVSGDNTTVAAGGLDGTLWSWNTGTSTAPLQSMFDATIPLDDEDRSTVYVYDVTFSPDDAYIAGAYTDGKVRVWNRSNGALVHTIVVDTSPVNTVKWYSDGGGSIIVAAGSNKTVSFWTWNGSSAAAGATFTDGDYGVIYDLAVSADNAYLAFVDAARNLVIRRLQDDATISFIVANAPANSVAFPGTAGTIGTATNGDWPDRILIGGQNGSVQEWQLKTADDSIWPEARVFEGHDLAVNEAVYTADDARVLSAANDEIQLTLLNEQAGYPVELRFAIPLPDDYPEEWPDFKIFDSYVDLDTTYTQALAGGWVVLENSAGRRLYRIEQNLTMNRQDFLLSERLSRLQLDTPTGLGNYGLRDTTVYLQSEELTLAAAPIQRAEVVGGDQIDLAGIVTELETGRVLIVSGKRSRLQVVEDLQEIDRPRMISDDGSQTISLVPGDILTVLESPVTTLAGETVWALETDKGFIGTVTVAPGAEPFVTLAADEDDEIVSEAVILKNVLQSQKYSTLQFEAPLNFSYDRLTVTIQANVVAATHGETISEVLGSGDASLKNQVFALREPPLTYVSAPTATGTETSLEVRVNDVLWEESPSLYDLGARDRKYAVRHDDDGTIRIIFGDGENGERLPTGIENISAAYRKGIGPDGQVSANTLRLMQTQPVGIAEVDNPLPATGASAPEDLGEARERAPFSVLTLDRIVSLKDFENFARGFGGIGKARAVSLWQDEIQLVYITVAGDGGSSVATNSGLYQNLIRSIDSVRDPFQPVRVASYEPLRFNIAAKLLIDASYIPERVFAAANTALRNHFAFRNRGFGQEVSAAEIVTVLESVDGVEAVDLDQLYLTSSVIFGLDIEPNQNYLESSSTVTTDLQSNIQAKVTELGLTDFDVPTTDALIFQEKRGLRWTIREPDAADGLAVVKERGRLNVYEYRAAVDSTLAAELARRDGSTGDFLPAQMLLLNEDTAGIILMQFI